jgi:hypothetical protein
MACTLLTAASVRAVLQLNSLRLVPGKRSPIVKLDKSPWLGLALSPDEKYLMYSVIENVSSNLMFVDRFQ